MSQNIDFLSIPFLKELIPSNKDKKPICGSFKGHNITQFVGSNTHFLFLDEYNQLYGFGSNLQHQISAKNEKIFTVPTRFDLINSEIVEIACGNNFSAILTEKSEVEIFGVYNGKIKKSLIRGLSATSNAISFGFDSSSVYVGRIENGSVKNTTYELPVPVLITAITDFAVSALGQDGSVYVLYNGSSTFTNLSVNGISITASHSSVTILGKNAIHVHDLQTNRTTTHYLPSGFKCVHSVSSFGDIFALSSDGRVSHCTTFESELSLYSNFYCSVPKIPIDRLKSISTVLMCGCSVMFVRGDPQHFRYEFAPGESPIACGQRIATSSFDDEFVYSTDKIAHFRNSTIPRSSLLSLACSARLDGASLFATSAQETIRLSRDGASLRSLNLRAGDTVRALKGGCIIEIAGEKNGRVWGRPFGCGYVVCLPSTRRSFGESFELIKSSGQQFANFAVDDAPAVVDVSSASIEMLGYKKGDLVWHPAHGVTEVVGAINGRLVLLELGERKLVSHEAVELRILRRKSPSKSGDDALKKLTRKVVDISGNVVEVDISYKDEPRAFLPTDRVLSPLGEATVLGFNGAPYIQTDEMRINGYEAVKANAFDLRLIRRIREFASRKFGVADERGKIEVVDVSLNTEDSPNELMPGDKIMVKDKCATVIGFVKSGDDAAKTVIKFMGVQGCVFLENTFSLVYRADINALRKSHNFPPMFVGSPLIQELAFLPGDVLSNSEIKQAVFFGYNNENVFLMIPKDDEIISFGFSLMLMPNIFKVIKSPALEFWNEVKNK